MIKPIFLIISKIPNSLAQKIGQGIGWLLYRFNHHERRVAELNIAWCFPELSSDKRAAMVKSTLQENAKTLVELPKIFSESADFSINLITEVQGLEHYQQAINSTNGVILLAPHIGNWEITLHYLNQFASITALYSPPKNAFLDAVIKNARQSSGATLVPADASGVRAQLKCLKQGGVIGILPDQVPKHSNAGVFAPFMGNETFTMTLTHNLAKRTQATILMTFAERLDTGAGYRLHIFPAPAGIHSSDAIASATAMNRGIEQCIALCPAQYQWTYKRFKEQPNDMESPYLHH